MPCRVGQAANEIRQGSAPSTVGDGYGSAAGYALKIGEPVLSNNLAGEERFRIPTLLVEHGIRSAINVPISGPVPFGAIEVHGTLRGEFVAADISFLQSLANVLVATLARHGTEQAKDQLLHEKDLLMQEVHHRVKNSLQLVRTLLHLQARTVGDDVRIELEKAARRIMTISAVHQRLYNSGSVTQTDAAAYLRELVADMQSMLSNPASERPIVVQAEPLLLPAGPNHALGRHNVGAGDECAEARRWPRAGQPQPSIKRIASTGRGRGARLPAGVRRPPFGRAWHAVGGGAC